MKYVSRWYVWAALAASCSTTLAQPGASWHQGPGPDSAAMGMPTSPEQAGSPTERWLQMLEEFNPDEYQRLIALQDQDPEAFRAEMRERLQKHRKQFIRRMHGNPPPPSTTVGGGAPGEDPEDRAVEVRTLLETIRPEVERLVEAYRNTENEDERAAIRQALRGLVAQVQEARIASHQRRIEQARAMLEGLESKMAARLEKQEQQLDRAVDRILSGKNRRPPPPPPAD
ncbi:MAG: hypothetical protein H7A43_02265 [Verrucomicrobia bacterium]|nr:hypothetical protein [Verrucomicrobiota bacterium]